MNFIFCGVNYRYLMYISKNFWYVLLNFSIINLVSGMFCPKSAACRHFIYAVLVVFLIIIGGYSFSISIAFSKNLAVLPFPSSNGCIFRNFAWNMLASCIGYFFSLFLLQVYVLFLIVCVASFWRFFSVLIMHVWFVCSLYVADVAC